MKPKEVIESEVLAAYLEHGLPTAEAARVEASLRDNPTARAHLAQLERIREALTGPVAELRSVDLVSSVRRQLQRPEPRRVERRWYRLWLPAVALVSSLAIFVALRSPLRDSEFEARSVDPIGSSSRWAAVKIYRVHDGAAPELLGKHLSRGDGLLFAYTNVGRKPFDYVTICGVSATGNVHWFHPAYLLLGENPRSIAIEHGKANVMLKEVVRHNYAPGPLSIYAIFSRRPLAVLEVEAWIAQQRGLPTSPPAPEASLQRLTVDVEP